LPLNTNEKDSVAAVTALTLESTLDPPSNFLGNKNIINNIRQQWTKEEDDMLLDAVEKYGIFGQWGLIQKYLENNLISDFRRKQEQGQGQSLPLSINVPVIVNTNMIPILRPRTEEEVESRYCELTSRNKTTFGKY